MDILLPEYKEMLHLLLKHKVNFMLIGGYAVIFHGYERTTTDLDIWLEAKDLNRDRLVEALSEFGIGDDVLKKIAEMDFKKIVFFCFGERPRRIDFLTSITGVKFEEAAPEVNYFSLGSDKVPIIQYYHLIRSKIANSRPQDKADVEMLQNIRKKKRD